MLKNCKCCPSGFTDWFMCCSNETLVRLNKPRESRALMCVCQLTKGLTLMCFTGSVKCAARYIQQKEKILLLTVFFKCPCHFGGRHVLMLLVCLFSQKNGGFFCSCWVDDLTHEGISQNSPMGSDWNPPSACLHLWGAFTCRLWITIVFLKRLLFKFDIMHLWGILWSDYFKAAWKKKNPNKQVLFRIPVIWTAFA